MTTQFAVEYAMASSRAWNLAQMKGGRAVNTTPTETLAQLYSKEEMIVSTREKRIEWIPIRVGSGPFDLAPIDTPECVFCDAALIDYIDPRGNVSALGVGVWRRAGGWVVAHTRCVRQVEDALCPCTCHLRLVAHSDNPAETVCCERFNEVEA